MLEFFRVSVDYQWAARIPLLLTETDDWILFILFINFTGEMYEEVGEKRIRRQGHDAKNRIGWQKDPYQAPS